MGSVRSMTVARSPLETIAGDRPEALVSHVSR